MTKTPDYIGHRARVRKKFLNSLGEELHDYELLEILLFAANPRQDTKPIAKKLLAKFENISSVINADIEMLKMVDGVGEASIVQIKVISRIIQKVLKIQAKNKPILNNWQLVLDYVSAALKGLNHEVFRVLFLDKKHQLIEDELVAIGENDNVVVSSKTIAKKALLLSAESVILFHNHPSGELRASAADISVTKEIIMSLRGLEIKVIDHIIISDVGYFSFKENGLL